MVDPQDEIYEENGDHDNFIEIDFEKDPDQRVLDKQIELGIKPSNLKKKESGEFGRTPLHEAIAFSDLVLIKHLLDGGEDLRVRDNNQNTPYQMALLYGNKEVIALFGKGRENSPEL